MIVKDSTKNFNCFKSTWRYFVDKGVYLILLNIVPTLMLAFLISPSSTMYYLFYADKVDATNLGSLFGSMWDLPYSFWYIGIVGIVMLVFTGSVSFGVIDRHMRVGEFTVSPRYIKNRLNYNLLTGIKFVIVAVLSLEFFSIVTTVLYYLWANLFSNYATRMVFNVLTLCLMEIGMITTMSMFILWPPYMLHTGLKSFNAFKRAWSSMSGKTFQAIVAILTVVLPLQIIMAITAALNAGVICRTILDAIAYAIVVPFYFTLMYNIFYDVTGTERMDIVQKQKNIWTKK